MDSVDNINSLMVQGYQMIKGETYLISKQKRNMDVALAQCVLPGAHIALRLANDDQPLFNQTRIGRDESKFEVHKVRTLDNDDIPLSRLTAMFRRYGIDELPQAHNILKGDMTVVGWRALTPEDLYAQYDAVGHDLEGSKIVDDHRAHVLSTKPGIVSEYAIDSHHGNIDEVGVGAARLRIESEIRYVGEASPLLDIRLMRRLLIGIVMGKMTNSSTTIQYE